MDSLASSFYPTLGSKSDFYITSMTVIFAASESATDSLNIEIQVILMYLKVNIYYSTRIHEAGAQKFLSYSCMVEV